ncbi:MAG: GNAT family N-acetyltransferase [Halanaerobiales bacterium]|nr:GNAT family N-acetyltransferase [Halanaerobiales bacterium]
MKIVILTERLKLIALKEQDLKDSITNLEKFYKENNLKSKNNQLSELMIRIYDIKLSNIKKDPENYLFYTYWLIVKKTTNEKMGSLGFKDTPDNKKSIEVGYGINKKFRCEGYVTEALLSFLNWSFKQNINPINTVVAKTNQNNLASQRVLKNTGFKHIKFEKELMIFKKENDIK